MGTHYPVVSRGLGLKCLNSAATDLSDIVILNIINQFFPWNLDRTECNPHVVGGRNMYNVICESVSCAAVSVSLEDLSNPDPTQKLAPSFPL